MSSCSETSGVVHHFMTQRLRSKGFAWTSDHPSSSSSSSSSTSCTSSSAPSLFDTLISQANELMADYGEAIQDMVDRAVSQRQLQQQQQNNLVIDSIDCIPSSTSSISPAAVDPPLDNYNAFRLMADSMISDGIQWSHILTLMVFVSELAYEQGVRHQQGVTFIASCSDWLVRYFNTDPIRSFLEANGGWEGMISWAEDKSSSGNSPPPSAGANSSPSLTNGLLLGIGSAVTAAIALFHFRP